MLADHGRQCIRNLRLLSGAHNAYSLISINGDTMAGKSGNIWDTCGVPGGARNL